MAAMTWALLSIFVIAPLGALALDRPLFGNWIWRIDLENLREHEWAFRRHPPRGGDGSTVGHNGVSHQSGFGWGARPGLP